MAKQSDNQIFDPVNGCVQENKVLSFQKNESSHLRFQGSRIFEKVPERRGKDFPSDITGTRLSFRVSDASSQRARHMPCFRT
jgi:hypothetical protein